MMRRRSPRLLALAAQKGGGGSATANFSSISRSTSERRTQKEKGKKTIEEPPTTKKRRKTPRSTNTKAKSAKKKQPSTTDKNSEYLPRLREEELKRDYSNNDGELLVIGVDEAGRGPLAGPVVAAAAIIPTNIVGVTDSKQLTKEEDREFLYEKIISSPDARWSVAIVDAKRIDEINILQATLTAMKMATSALISREQFLGSGEKLVRVASSKVEGSYVVCSSNNSDGQPFVDDDKISMRDDTDLNKKVDLQPDLYYALIDGNRVPEDFPCDCEAVVKGDSKEYAIGAASILAKVTRDRIMREYDTLYPEYELSRHKGYPTALHMTKVRELGATPIHRRTFAPLKHMTFDKNGNIVEDDELD